MRVLLFSFLLSSTLLAQTEQPQKESTSDLRTSLNMFVIEDLNDKSVFWLERTANLDYMLRMKKNENETSLQKITTKDALRLDREFASKFLKIQYEVASLEGDCKVTLRLSMKGEVQDICKKDEKKTQEITPFMKDLENRLLK